MGGVFEYKMRGDGYFTERLACEATVFQRNKFYKIEMQFIYGRK